MAKKQPAGQHQAARSLKQRWNRTVKRPSNKTTTTTKRPRSTLPPLTTIARMRTGTARPDTCIRKGATSCAVVQAFTTGNMVQVFQLGGNLPMNPGAGNKQWAQRARTGACGGMAKPSRSGCRSVRRTPRLL